MAKKQVKRGGIKVTMPDGTFYNYPTSVGWNVGGDGVLYVAAPERIEQDGRLVNALLASFKLWAHVTWL